MVCLQKSRKILKTQNNDVDVNSAKLAFSSIDQYIKQLQNQCQCNISEMMCSTWRKTADEITLI